MVKQSRTRVVRLITRLNIGGPARQALLLTRDLRETWPTLLAAGTPARHEGELADPEVDVTSLPLVRPIRPWSDARAVSAVRSLLRSSAPAILHTHMAKAGLVGRLAAATLDHRPRIVHTFHGHVLEGYFNKPLQRVLIEVERELARRSDVLIAISPEIRDALLDLGIGRPQQFRIIPLGFDLTAHLAVTEPSGQLREKIGVAPDVPVVGIVGRLVPIKDVGILLQATARLDDVHVAILGDGESRKELENRASALGIRHRTHFMGWWTDVPAAMSDLDIVALTSRNEGTPVSLIEASACARAVVASDVGGVRFVVRNGETGLLCPPGDPTAVAAALVRLFEDPALRWRLGQRGRESVRVRFHKDRLVSDVAALYEDLAGRLRARV